MSERARWAVYYTPPAEHPLAHVGNAWLGRTQGTAAARPAELGEAEWEQAVATPRRYGLHATIKAPMRLGSGVSEADLHRCVAGIARRQAPFLLPPLAVTRMGDFLALRPVADCPPLAELASTCVTECDPLRAPLTDDEIARRRPGALTPRQQELLHAWGYPHVFEQFRFHITLTGRLDAGTLDRLQPLLEDWFAPALRAPLRFEDLSLWQERPGYGVFDRVTRIPLVGV